MVQCKGPGFTYQYKKGKREGEKIVCFKVLVMLKNQKEYLKEVIISGDKPQ